MNFDLLGGQLVPYLKALEDVFGFRPSPAFGWRIRVHGVQVRVRRADGTVETRRVRCPAVKIGRRVLTTVEAARAFVAATNPAVDLDGLTALAGEDHGRDTALDARLRVAGLLGDDSADVNP